MNQRIKQYLFIWPLLLILALSYCRYTYIINPNFQGDPVLLNYRAYIDILGANSLVNIRSIIFYWAMFFLGNLAFFLVLFSSIEKVKAIILFYLIISFASGVFFVADRYLVPSKALFSLGAIMKNFILSPIFTAMAYIIVEYFHWFGKSNEL